MTLRQIVERLGSLLKRGAIDEKDALELYVELRRRAPKSWSSQHEADKAMATLLKQQQFVGLDTLLRQR